MMDAHDEIQRLVDLALREDLGELGDVTSAALLRPDEVGRAKIIARQAGVVAGTEIAARVFRTVDSSVRVEARVADGARVNEGEELVSLYGPLAAIFTAERTALNFLQHLSGIATLTSKFVAAVHGTRAVILDTRKTTPGLRRLEKAAVVAGGGTNHRMGLYDMVLIKENHLAAAGGIAKAVSEVKRYLRSRNLVRKIEVEIKSLAQLAEAVDAEVDRIMLDNLDPSAVREAVRQVAGRAELEVSGGVALENVREFAVTGVDYISVGALTHSAPALDLSLLVCEN
ncbi:MAG: carboxylating nicotinate-nucleotide diphosphorylase [Calditrichaeota bacterium]|nr:MAG: carboxylating nicotinate-nucleotide diphosphorylase [Calditrichota bacterium]